MPIHIECHFRSERRSADCHSLSENRQDLGGSIVEVFGNLRLQNRGELIALLGLADCVDDFTIVQHGWQRWRLDLAPRLRGSFAIVIFDRSTSEIYAARDFFGLEPLFLASIDGRWIFADNPRDARSAANCQFELNTLKIADFLTGNVVERDKTFYLGLERLPAAHWLQIKSGKSTVARYWSAKDAPSHSAYDDLAGRFRALFDRSVSFNAKDCQEICVLVSGGLDSSSVLASLLSGSQTDRHVIGLTRSYCELPDWSDGQYISLLTKNFDFDHFQLPSESISPLEGMELVIAANDGPVSAYGFAAMIPLYKVATAAGVQVILDGHGGDEVVSHGIGLLNELAQKGHWLRLWRVANWLAQQFDESPFRYFMPYLVHIPAIRASRNMLRRIRKSSNAFEESSILSSDLIAQAGPNRYDSRQPASRATHTERDIHEFLLNSPIQQYAQELLVVVGRAFGVEPRMPFLDRDLVEFSLSVPAEAKLKNGLTRAILRDAMNGSLPHELLSRPDKFDFSTAFIRGLELDRVRLLQLTDPAEHNLRPYVNETHLNELRNQIVTNPQQITIETARTLFRVAQLSIWLKSLK